MMCIPENCVGYFIPFRSRVNMVMIAGIIKMRGNTLAAPMHGRVLAWMKRTGFYLRRLVLHLMIFMEAKDWAMILFANCVLALDAKTGKRIWHFQTVHHDVWDRDLPTAPVLVNIKKDGKNIDAVAQITKSGFIFLLDRKTGKPLYPVNEVAVPTQS